MLARLAETTQLSRNVFSFTFEPERHIHYLPGQFVEVTLPHTPDELGVSRKFTLSSSPSDPIPAFTVRFPAKPSSYKQMLTALKPGDVIHVDDALGDFVLPRLEATPLLWVAGGIGITPFRSHAAWIASQHEHRPITFLHRTGQDTALWPDVFNRAGITPQAFLSTTDLSIALTKILQQEKTQDSLAYIAGSDSFIQAVRKQLSQSKNAPYDIVVDAFLGY